MKSRFVKKYRIVLVLIVVLFSQDLFAVAPKHDLLDKTKWFDCFSSESCSAQAKLFKKNLSDGTGDIISLVAYTLSSLLSMYLDDSPEKSGIDEIVEAENILYMYPNHKEVDIVKSMIYLLKGENIGGDEQSNSFQFIKALSIVDNRHLFQEKALQILKSFHIPLLEYMLASFYLERKKYDLALVRLDKLFKKYHNDSKVFRSWAEASLGAKRNISKLSRILKKRCKSGDCDWLSRTLYLKLLIHKGDERKLMKFFDSIDLYIIDGEYADLFFLEYANYLLSKNEYTDAEYYLEKAREINPENLKVYWALGRVYFARGDRKVQSIAMLKHYAGLMKESIDRFRLMTMIEKYEKEEIDN